MAQRATDAVVDASDVLSAIEEIRRGDGPALMQRLWQTEPYLAAYLEGAAAHLSHRLEKTPSNTKDGVALMDNCLDFGLTLIRAVQHGQYRLWRDSVPPTSPLARL